MPFQFEPIGVVHSCFKEKFGIPRQPGLAPHARATLELLPPYDRDEALRGLEGFSHLWIVFVFHGCLRAEWRPTVRPPRLGGNERMGVFATRSMFRPNPIGLSVAALERFGRESGRMLLHLNGLDLLDGTPVLDIKPYLPYVDAVEGARGGFAGGPPALREVRFIDEAEAACRAQEARWPGLRLLIEELLRQDPRPAYRTAAESRHGMRLYDLEVRWRVEEGRALVVQVVPCDPTGSEQPGRK